jgi:O-antigen/teichoic acid export membrane protein
MFFLLPVVFSTVFGAQWSGAGELARYLLPGFAMQFVVSPLSLSNQLNMRNRFGLVGNLVALGVMCGTLLVAAGSGAAVEQALLAMSIAQACYYAGFGYLIFMHVSAARRMVPNP